MQDKEPDVHARAARPDSPAAARALGVLLLALALTPLASCTRAYMHTLENEMSLSPAELLELRITEARDALGPARDALAHADDGLRDLAMDTPDGAERRHADLERRAQRAQAAALDARRRIASVYDVAPAYLATIPHDDPAVPAYRGLARALEAADRSLLAAMDHLAADLPTLGAAPSPGAADALRAPLHDAIDSTARALEAADRFAPTLQEGGRG